MHPYVMLLAVVFPSESLGDMSDPYTDATEARVFRTITGAAVSFRDPESLKLECLRLLPEGDALPHVTVELSEPWQHGSPHREGEFVASWTLVLGTSFLHGVPIAGANTLFVFTTDDRLVALEHAVLPPDTLKIDPGLPAVTADQAVQIVKNQLLVNDGADYTIQAKPLSWLPELKRYVHTVTYLPAWRADKPVWRPEYWVPQWAMVDGQSGETLRRGDIPLFAPNVSGAVSGNVMPHRGPAVRRAYGPDNQEMFLSLPYIPLKLVVAGGNDLGPILTSQDGGFTFILPTDGNWGLSTFWEGNDEFKRFVVVGTELIEGSAVGVGSHTVALTLNPEPLAPRAWENAVGNLTGWLYLFSGKRFSEELRDRNFRWPRGLSEFTRGFPGWWEIEYIPLPADDDTIPVLGVYQDAFPPVRKLGISEANNIFAHSSIPATWHELGHALASAFTGQINEGGAWSHNAIVEEGIADFWSVLLQQRADLAGELTGEVGLGMERGFPTSFHRHVGRGLVCPHDADPATPCVPEGEHDLFPGFGGIHAASLPFSGFWHDILSGFLNRYGEDAGLMRTADTFIRWLDWHRGRHLPAFGRYSVFEVLAINDSEGFGGNDIPFDGTPDSDIIIQAAAARNFWLHDFVRGNVNEDERLDLSDAMATLAYLFLGKGEPDCLDAADSNDSGNIDLSDAVTTLSHLFLGGDSLPPPDTCGKIDPTPNDRLTCVLFPYCNR